MLRVLRDRWRICVAAAGFVLLAGCAGHYFAQREPWRKEAELACLQSGTVKESGTIVRIDPINGPGTCGADFPLKIAALGDSALMGYSDLRPPGDVPNASPGPQRWPVATAPVPSPRAVPQPRPYPEDEPRYANPARSPAVQRQPLAPSQSATRSPGAPMQIVPQQPHGSGGYDRGASREPVYREPSVRTPATDYARTPSRRPSVYDAPSEPAFDDEDDAAQRRAPQASPFPTPLRSAPGTTYQPPLRAAPPTRSAMSQSPVPFGRGAVSALGPVEIKPAATLACPMVSALDRWIIDAVQPAAQRWFRQKVVEIRQISAYSCRGMNGQPGARISEHAFGNALDISSFTLADGRRITVKNGWRGSPEEQGFLRDVQGAACEQFNTVLAPGSNRFHYDHFHFDLMRRRSANRICNPDAIAGEVVAARAARDRGYAWRPDPGFTGSVGKSGVKSRSAALSKPKLKAKTKRNILDDDDWIEDDGPRPED